MKKVVQKEKLCFASDNWVAAHPDILAAVLEANVGFAPAYGNDPWTEEAQNLLQKTFRKKCKVFFVPTGTGSNIFALRLCLRPFESVISSSIAHLLDKESGAAEAIAHCKILYAPHIAGKITPEAIEKLLRKERAPGKHATSPRVLSITQPTEIGTVYQLHELKAIASLCKKENLLLHIDGSRLYNAAISLGVELHEIIDAAQADILSLGGTKNGLMGAESLLIFNPDLHHGSDHIQKQSLQLLSKMRYLSAQYIPFFKNDLWRPLALNANTRAKQIAQVISSVPHLQISYPVETNQIFFTGPETLITKLQEHIHCHLWDATTHQLRFLTSWNTPEEEVALLKALFQSC